MKNALCFKALNNIEELKYEVIESLGSRTLFVANPYSDLTEEQEQENRVTLAKYFCTQVLTELTKMGCKYITRGALLKMVDAMDFLIFSGQVSNFDDCERGDAIWECFYDITARDNCEVVRIMDFDEIEKFHEDYEIGMIEFSKIENYTSSEEDLNGSFTETQIQKYISKILG